MSTDWSGFTNYFQFIADFIKSFVRYCDFIIGWFKGTFGYFSECFQWFTQFTGAAQFNLFSTMISISLIFLLLKFVRWGK